MKSQLIPTPPRARRFCATVRSRLHTGRNFHKTKVARKERVARTHRALMLMNADIFNQRNWRGLRKCHLRLKGSKYSRLRVPSTTKGLWQTYWIIVDTIHQNSTAVSRRRRRRHVTFSIKFRVIGPTRCRLSGGDPPQFERSILDFRDTTFVSESRVSLEKKVRFSWPNSRKALERAGITAHTGNMKCIKGKLLFFGLKFPLAKAHKPLLDNGVIRESAASSLSFFPNEDKHASWKL